MSIISFKKNHTSATLCIFVHGLGGGDDKEYWGKIPDFIFDDVNNSVDVLVWTYKSDKKFHPKLLEIIRTERSLLGSKQNANILISKIQNIFTNSTSPNKYKKVLLVGHSYGGIVSLQCVLINLKENQIPITAVALCASPTRPNIFAKLHTLFLLGRNRQTKELAKGAVYWEVFKKQKTKILDSVSVWYLEAGGDSIVPKSVKNDNFVHKVHEGGHLWTNKVKSRDHAGYDLILEFVNEFN